MGLCGIYRKTEAGWKPAAKRYFAKFTHQSKIKEKQNDNR
jgi:hypothetical protein